MHQPPFVPHEEGMRPCDGEIVHHDGSRLNGQLLYHTPAAIQAAYMLPHQQLTCRDPAALGSKEGVLWSGDAYPNSLNSVMAALLESGYYD